MDDAIHRNNMRPLEQRWPELAAVLKQQDVGTLDACLTEGLCNTISINGIQLSSRHDRAAEAVQQADSIPNQPVITLYGTGLGDLPRTLLKRQSLEKLHIKILNPAVFLLILYLAEMTDCLLDPRVELSLAHEDSEIHQPFFALAPELQLAEDDAHGIKQRLEIELSDNFVRSSFRADDPKITARLSANKSLLESDDDAAKLFDAYPDYTALVVGAGPTLTDNLPALNKALASRKKYVIFCVDTAVKVLHDAGITPDVVVSIDQRIGLEHLGDFPTKDTRLVYFPLVSPDVLKAWRGKRYAAYSASPIYESLAKALPKARLHSGGSVIHPAVDLARKSGCSSIVLLGVDFGYPNNRTHAGWKDGDLGPSLNTATSWTINGKGERIKSDSNFNSYRCELERYITAHNSVPYYNTSQDGARIEGCDYHPEFCA